MTHIDSRADQDLTPDQDDIDRYLDEYRKTLSAVATMVAKYPEHTDELREMLKFGASMLVTNKPGFKEEYQGVVGDIDEFLEKCQRGEIDPESFITEARDLANLAEST